MVKHVFEASALVRVAYIHNSLAFVWDATRIDIAHSRPILETAGLNH